MHEPVLVAWADSRPQVGVGHVVRSFALAQAWVDHGGRAVLCTTDLSDTVAVLTHDPRVEQREVPAVMSPFDEAGARAFAKVAHAAGASWVSIDSYDTCAEAQRVLRSSGVRVLVIDDHGLAAPYDADILVDQNLGADARPLKGHDGVDGVDEACLGASYTLLRRAVRVSRDADPVARDRVVVMLGGNPSPAVATLGREIAACVATRVPVDLVMGRGGPPGPVAHGVAVQEIATDAARLFARAAVVVSNAGSTAWELCATKSVGVLVAVAPNQEPVGEALHQQGAAAYLGRMETLDATQIAHEVFALLESDDRRALIADRAGAVVDGFGASRVVGLMRSKDLTLRPAERTDAERYFAWANDPAVRAASFSTEPIEWDDHLRWFDERLKSDSCCLYVAHDTVGDAIGQIRFDLDGDAARVGISLAAPARGRGHATPLIVAGVRTLSAAQPLVRMVRAEVRATNRASARAFTAAGFAHRDRVQRDGITTDVYEWASRSDHGTT